MQNEGLQLARAGGKKEGIRMEIQAPCSRVAVVVALDVVVNDCWKASRILFPLFPVGCISLCG